MTPAIRLATAIAVCGSMMASVPAAGAGAARPQLSGSWRLNRAASELPREVGFDPDADTGASGDGRSANGGQSRGGRSGRGGGGGGSIRVNSPTPRFEGEEDTRKIRELVSEVKSPPDHLTVAQTDTSVTITDDRDRIRVFHTNGKEETQQLEAGPIGVTARWENDQLVIRYQVEKDRELRYRLSHDASGRLVVRAQFAERGKGPVITRVYDAQ